MLVNINFETNNEIGNKFTGEVKQEPRTRNTETERPKSLIRQNRTRFEKAILHLSLLFFGRDSRRVSRMKARSSFRTLRIPISKQSFLVSGSEFRSTSASWPVRCPDVKTCPWSGRRHCRWPSTFYWPCVLRFDRMSCHALR